MVVGQVVECGNIFMDAHGASVEEGFAGWVGPELGLISSQRSSVAVSKER